MEREQQSLENQVSETSESVTFVAPAATDPSSTRDISMSKREIQKALKNAGYYYGPIDGKIGNKSKRAIREFQADHGLKVDGIVGSQTKQALLKYLSIK
ncbi:MAG: hypothetical protein GF408_06360 [Candidatus Omnitrophica bacterium]|nr:hypothetical protein [Candidatus Omnitrophota bacterium]